MFGKDSILSISGNAIDIKDQSKSDHESMGQQSLELNESGSISGLLGNRTSPSPRCKQEATRRSTRIRTRYSEKILTNSPLYSNADAIKKQKRKKSKQTQEPPNRPKRMRKLRHPYGLTPGETPYPNHAAPTAEQAEKVFKLLADRHGYENTSTPTVAIEPSLEKAGCGEAPAVHDALLRTVLSANTTFDHANNMLKALINKYGVSEQGIGKGSVNWEKIRLASVNEVQETIKVGGLQDIKAKYIKKILDAIYEKNRLRLKTQGSRSVSADQLISLDYMFGMTHDEAMDYFLKFPGVGVKTASCVTLFCLRLPSFPVDTHVFRITRWLKWVPETCANRDKVFMHCQIRIPDHLKYGLHRLFIRHGQTCFRCIAGGGALRRESQEWKETDCPLEGLLDRSITK